MLPEKIGRYEIRSELGRGGMATVYRAYDPRFKRAIAIKILPREFLHDPSFRARFEREAETIAALEHPAIVPVYDFGEEEGLLYLVMRLMTGGSLAERLTHGPLPLAEAARIFNRLSAGLDRAHAKGIIHRDLKPGNILFDDEDNPYISDFGIAKLTEASTVFTSTGGIVGTPAYMSPEQAGGERDLDGRSDIYSLGAIVFEMLTGKLPYAANTPMGMAVKHITEPIPRILEARADLPSACDALMQKAMAKKREKRFATASELAAALTAIAAGRPPAAQKAERERLARKKTESERLAREKTVQERLTGQESQLEQPTPLFSLKREIQPAPARRTSPWPVIFGLGLIGAIGFGVYALVMYRPAPEPLVPLVASTETVDFNATSTASVKLTAEAMAQATDAARAVQTQTPTTMRISSPPIPTATRTLTRTRAPTNTQTQTALPATIEIIATASSSGGVSRPTNAITISSLEICTSSGCSFAQSGQTLPAGAFDASTTWRYSITNTASEPVSAFAHWSTYSGNYRTPCNGNATPYVTVTLAAQKSFTCTLSGALVRSFAYAAKSNPVVVTNAGGDYLDGSRANAAGISWIQYEFP